MIAVFNEIETIYNQGMGHTLFYGEAKQGTPEPYGVVTCPNPSPNGNTFTAKIKELTIQINIYYSGLDQAFAGLDQCTGLFDDTVLSVIGCHPVKLRNEFETFPEKLGDTWMIVIEYRCLVQKLTGG